MAKAFIVIKILLFAITVFDGLSNGDCFKLTTTLNHRDTSTLGTFVTTTTSTNTDHTTDQPTKPSRPSSPPETSNTIYINWQNLTNISDDSFSKAQFIGDIIVKLSVFLYSCLAIAYLCDQYFVPSLEFLGKSFHLPPDITGAIIIPIGTSGPEIFSSAIGVFFTSNDIGTGAIIGSAVFNLLAIPAACGLAVAYFIGRPVKLDALPILRDLLFYILSIIVLILVIKDNKVDIIDSSLLTLLFAIYVGVMIYNAKLSMKNSDQLLDKCIDKSSVPVIDRSESTPLLKDNTQIVLQQLAKNCDDNYGNFNGKYQPMAAKTGYQEIVDKKLQMDDNLDDDNESSIMNNCFCSLILSPVYILFWVTMPKRWPTLMFIVSIVWLTGLSYGTVWAISGLSDILSIPHTISGMTLLAAGSAVPDLVTSIIVIKKTGLASMGLCAAIASNIFAIVVGLGVPWLLQCLVRLGQSGGSYSQAFIPIESDALPYTSIVLLIMIFAFLLSLKVCKWKLYTKLSLICALIHLIFLGASVSLELFVHS